MTRDAFTARFEGKPGFTKVTNIDELPLIPRGDDTYEDGDILTLPSVEELKVFTDAKFKNAPFIICHCKRGNTETYVRFFITTLNKMKFEVDDKFAFVAKRTANGSVVDSWRDSAGVKDFLTTKAGKKFSVKLCEPFPVRKFDQTTGKLVDILQRTTVPTLTWL